LVAFSVTAALTVGFLAGLLTFKVKRRWCENCGQNLTCPSCLAGPEGAGRRKEES